MFFSSFGSGSDSATQGQSSQGPGRGHKRSRIAAIVLAAALAAPAVIIVYSHAQPAIAQQTQAQDPAQQLQQGMKQYKDKQYEEASQTLSSINSDALSASNQSMLRDTLAKAQAAAEQRQAARAEFDAGERALQAGMATEAATHYRAAADNDYADSGTKQKSQEQLALARSMIEAKAGDLKQTYRDAVADYKAKRYNDARQKFETLQAANYKAGLFEKSPSDYLKDINKKAPANTPANTEVAATPTFAPAVPPANANTTAPNARTNTAPAAPAPAPAPTAMNTSTSASPAPAAPTAQSMTAQPMTARPQPAANTAVAQATTPAPAPTPTPAAVPENNPPTAVQPPNITENQGPEEPVVSRSSAKDLYKLARQQYKKGDWISARKNFMAAQAAGYKPGLFEDSPQKYLERMDKKEAADRAESEAKARAAQQQQNNAVAVAPMANVQSTPAPATPTPMAQAPSNAAPATPAPVTPAPAPQNSNTVVAQARPSPAPVTPAPAPVTPAPVTPAPVTPAPVTPAPAPAVTPAAPATPAPTANAPATNAEELAATARMEQASAEQKTAEARRLVDQARAAQNQQNYADALNLYTRATELDPNNAAAKQGRNEMLTMTGRAAPASQLDREAQRIRIARQEINYQFDQALNEMRNAIGRNDYTAAQDALNRARVARNSNPNVFTPEEMRTFDARLATAQSTLTTSQQEFQRLEAQRQATETRKSMEEARRQQEAERVRTVADLTRTARQLVNETRYKEALDVLDQILVLDPTNDYASGVRPLVEDKALIQEQRRYREDFQRQFTRQLNAAEEKKIPYDDILRYPTNWPDISELRDQTTSQELGHGAVDAQTQAQLDKKIPEIRFDNIAFDAVVDFLRDISGANIFVNWRALEQSGIDKNTPVSARLHDVKFAKALQTILADVGGGTVKLGYTVDEGVITISTDEDLSRNTLTRVYDIRDLIIDVPDFPGPQVQLSSVGQGGGGRSGGGGNTSLFSDTGSTEDTTQTQPKTRQQLVDDIVKLITETVAADSWREAGGTIGSVRELSGQLIVTQTPENQRQLQGLLEQLRETRAIQITIETRFLTVQRNFLEDIGFDVDLLLNRDRTSDSKWSTIPITQDSIIYTSNPATGLPGSITNVNNGSSAGGVNGLGLASLALSGTYLDNFAVQFLLRATQAAQSSTLLTAPRLTLFNGQRAYVAVTRVTAYVSDLEPVVAQNAVAFNPTISLFPSGVVLDVQATVSADRKYVTLTLRPTLTTLLDLLPFTFQSTEATSGTTTTQPSNGGIIPIFGGGTNPAAGTIQTPIFQLTQVRTTVSVPDGGTLLLGGQTLAGEVEREAGVPVLSKIPFLKRLFTNRSMAKDEQVLLILVKPTIVISREQEQRQFPLLSNHITQ